MAFGKKNEAVVVGPEEVDHGHGEGGVIEWGFEPAAHMANVICSWILLASMAVALLNLLLLVIQHLTGIKFNMVLAVTQPARSPVSIHRISLELGRFVAFSLLFLVPADVLETLLKPTHAVTMEELYKIGLVGLIRTTLAYFLGKEVEELTHMVHEEKHEKKEEKHEKKE